MSTVTLGLQLVSKRLASSGVECNPVAGSRGDLIVRTGPGERPVTVRVFTRSAPSPAGGKAGAKLTIAWDVPAGCSTDYVALVDLSSATVWMMTVEEVRLLRQQAKLDPMRLVMSFDPTLVSKHERIQASDFDEFRLERWSTRPITAPDGPEQVLDEVIGAVEGRTRQALVNHRLREQRLRRAKLAAAKAAAVDGKLRCQVPNCEFCFEETYGEIGEGFAHVHHLQPLENGERITSLSSLAVVCANCHAMIHRGGECRDIAGLIPSRAPSPGAA